MGQRNSGGVSSCLCCGTVAVVAEADRWWKENHLFLLVPPIARGGEREKKTITIIADGRPPMRVTYSENEITIFL